MELTKEWLSEQCACQEGINWFENSGKTESSEVIELLLKDEKLGWANWLVVRLLSQKDIIRYAIFAVEQVVGLFENKFPDEKRPRQAIEAAKAAYEGNDKASMSGTLDAALAAWSAVDALSAGSAGSAWAARAAGAAMQEKIVRYGLDIHRQG
jgi:hypothetical protein